MQGVATGSTFERPTQSLAINRDVFADLAAHLVEPLLGASDEPGWVEQCEHAAEGIVRRNAVFESQNVRSHGSSLPKRSMSDHVSAPAMLPHRATTTSSEIVDSGPLD